MMKTRRIKLDIQNNQIFHRENNKYFHNSHPRKVSLHTDALINKRREKNNNVSLIQFNFGCLDYDILSKIFGFVDLFQLCQISLVSKAFNNIHSQNLIGSDFII